MKEFVEYIVKNLVEHPENVDIRCYEKESRVLVEVRVNPLDMGKVVGKGGGTINALRTIVSQICARLGLKGHLELIS